jgi:uncharacterized protein with PQ loop repeat
MVTKKTNEKKGFFDNVKDEAKKFYESIKSKKFIEFLKEEAKIFLAREFKDSLIDVIRREIKEIKTAIIKAVAFGIFLFSGIVMIIIGVAELLANFFPVLSGGYNYLIFGAVLVIVALLMYYNRK